MIAIIFALSYINAQLTFWGPDGLSGKKYNNMLSNFGNPAVFDVDGKIEFVTIEESCTNFDIEEDSIVIIKKSVSDFTCYFSRMALDVQQKGGKGVIFKVSSSIIMIPVDYEEAKAIDIFAIAISGNDYDKIKSYDDEVIWATYKYKGSKEDKVKIKYILDSSTEDKDDFDQLRDLVDSHSINSNDIELILGYDKYLFYEHDKDEDCIEFNSETLCKSPLENINGKERLNIITAIINYYYNSIDNIPIQDLLEFVLEFYDECSDDYTLDCLEKYFSDEGITPDYSYDVIEDHKEKDHLASSYLVNDVFYPWYRDLNYFYCLSQDDADPSCELCSSGCTYENLADNDCNSSCNNTDCGYDDLECLVESNCLYFMLGDGICNSGCSEDPDCENDNDKSMIYAIIVGSFSFLL